MTNARKRYVGAMAAMVLLGGFLFFPNPKRSSQDLRRSFSPAITFEPNRGQWRGDLRMLGRSRGGLVALRDDRIELINAAADSSIELKWLNGNGSPALVGELAQSHSNYFLGNRSEKWLTNVPHYSAARYQEVYPGIDLALHEGKVSGSLEYDFVVQAGGDPGQIQLEFSDVSAYEMSLEGDLLLHVGGATITQRAPIAYQVRDGERHNIPVSFHVISASPLRVGFNVSKYDPNRELVIDPVIEYGRFFGGSQEDEILAIAADKDGYVYMTGETSSPDLPLAGDGLKHQPSAFQTKGNTLAFVAKLDPTGTRLIYCTYLGGSKTAVGHNLKIDSAGNAYIGGRTEASDFPLMKPIQAKFGGGSDDGFIAKLNAVGNALIYSTYIGGSEYDQGRALAVDSAGNAYMTGITESANFPLKNPIQAKYAGKQDSFALKLNAAGTEVIYSTYLGGSGDDVGHAIAVDAAGNAYITGLTSSADFPTANPLQRSFKGGEGDDTIVVKINPAGSSLIYSTFLGGSRDDEARAIAVDRSGNAVVAGYTQSQDFPLSKPLQSKFGGGSHDIFAFSLRPSGNALNWSTFLGGTGGDFGRGLAVDASGNVFLTGYTDSQNFPLANASQSKYGGGAADVFYAKLDPGAQKLLLSSFLGGGAYERGRGMAVNLRGDLYISGRTESKDFPVTKPHSPAFGGGPNDGFIVKIQPK